MKKIIFLITLVLILSGCMKGIKVRATVLEHVITSNRMGDRTFTTIIKTSDGYVQELTGLQYYGIPVGKTFTIEVFRPEK